MPTTPAPHHGYRAFFLASVATALISGCSNAAEDIAPDPSSERAQPASAVSTYRARGNEPGWHVDIGADAIVLVTGYGAQRLAAPKPAAEVVNGSSRYTTQANGQTLQVEIAPGPCVDTMSGMPYPDRVTTRLGDETWHGCGGEPAALLTGREWMVQDMPGGITAEARGTLAFDAAGRVSGQAFCNRFGGPYALTGEMLTIGPLAATKMACEPPLMDQEQRFLALLEAVVGFAIGDDGALLLRTRDDASLTLVPVGLEGAFDQSDPSCIGAAHQPS